MANGGGGTVTGTISGSTITFSGITTTVTTTAVTINNIRVNASALPVASGVPTGVAETIFLGGVNATPAVAAPVTVAYALNGLGAVAIPSASIASNTICAGAANTLSQFILNVSENFANSFKTLATESGTNGTFPATNGTRLTVTIANIPANVSVYVPLTVATSTAGGAGVLTAITSPTAKTTVGNNAPAAGTSAPLTTYAAVSVSGTTGTVYYELTTAAAPGVLETYPINVYYAAKAAAVPAPTNAATASVSFAPIGSTTSFPNFVVGSSTGTPVNGSAFVACATTLLFPFATNGGGFDTGLAISNTSTDQLALTSKGAITSSVTPQSGTCSLTFFGTAAPAAAVVTPSVATGTTWANSVSSLAPGFTGYVIANCNFLYAHAFAYVSYNLTQGTGVSMGYLGLTLPVSNLGTTTAARTAATTAAPEALNN